MYGRANIHKVEFGELRRKEDDLICVNGSGLLGRIKHKTPSISETYLFCGGKIRKGNKNT